MNSYCVVVKRKDEIFGIYEVNGEQLTRNDLIGLKSAITKQLKLLDVGLDNRFTVELFENINCITLPQLKETILQDIVSDL